MAYGGEYFPRNPQTWGWDTEVVLSSGQFRLKFSCSEYYTTYCSLVIEELKEVVMVEKTVKVPTLLEMTCAFIVDHHLRIEDGTYPALALTTVPEELQRIYDEVSKDVYKLKSRKISVIV
jgi:hypothetical protein